MPRRPWRTVALILALLLGAPAVCLAQLGERPERQPHFTRIAVGFSRLVRENRWTPVRILVKNPGKETEVQVSVTAEDSSGAPLPMVTRVTLRLPAYSVRAHTIHVRPESCERLVFEMYDRGRRTNRDVVQPLFLSARDTLLVGVAYSEQSFGCFQQAAREGASARIHFNNALAAHELPDRWQGYDAVDVIALGPLPPQGLTFMQEQAILDWVRAGGVLIVTPGNNAARYEGSLVEAALPVRILGTRLVESLPPLERAYGPIRRIKSRIGLAESFVTDGVTLLQMDQLPLVVARSEGAGQVVFVAFDLAAERLVAWAELWRVYHDLFERRGNLPPPAATALPQEAAQVLQESVGVRVLPRSVLAACLLVNLALVVGVLAGFRRRRVRALAGLVAAAPLIALAINAVGSAWAGVRETSLAGVHFVRTASGRAEASGVGYFGLLSPGEAVCDIEFPDAPSAFPQDLALPVAGKGGQRTAADALRSSYELEDGDLKALRRLQVRPRAPATFQASYLATMPGAVEARAVFGADGIRVRVVNRSRATLAQGFVAANRNAKPLTSLGPGDTAELLLDSSTAQGLMARFSSAHIKSEQTAQRDRLVQALYRPRRVNDLADTGLAVGGWFEGEPASVKLSGLAAPPRAMPQTCWLVRAEAEADRSRPDVLLPKGSLAMQFARPPANLLADGVWQPVFGGTEVEVDFVVPQAVRGLKARRIDFFLSVSREEAAAAVEAMDATTGRYDLIYGGPPAGVGPGLDRARPVKLGPGRLRLPDPEKYLSRTTGKVRLRVALQPILPPGVGVGPRRPVIEDFDLEIEGTRE